MNPIFLSLIISSKAVTGTAPIINNTHFIIRKGHLNYNKFVKKRRNKNTNLRLVFLARLLFKLLILIFLFEFFIRILYSNSLFEFMIAVHYFLGFAKIIRPAAVCRILVTITAVVVPIYFLPFSTTIIVPSSK